MIQGRFLMHAAATRAAARWARRYGTRFRVIRQDHQRGGKWLVHETSAPAYRPKVAEPCS